MRGEGRPVVKYRDTAVMYAKMAEPIEMPFGLRTWVGPENHVLDGCPDIPIVRGNFGERGAHGEYRGFLP